MESREIIQVSAVAGIVTMVITLICFVVLGYGASASNGLSPQLLWLVTASLAPLGVFFAGVLMLPDAAAMSNRIAAICRKTTFVIAVLYFITNVVLSGWALQGIMRQESTWADHHETTSEYRTYGGEYQTGDVRKQEEE